MEVGDPVWPVGSWRVQCERSKLPPGAHDGFKSSDTGIAFATNAKRATRVILYNEGIVLEIKS